MNRAQGTCRWGARVIGLSVLAGCLPGITAAQTPGAAAQAQPVDAGAKQLLAANGLYARGLYELAAGEYNAFLQQYPDHPQAAAARYALAICHYRLKGFDKAIEGLHQVLGDAKFEQRDEALAVLGHCELSLRHHEQAVAAFDELLAKYPDSKQCELAALNRAQALYLLKRYPDSAQACQAYLEKYPQSASRPDGLYFMALAQRAQGQNVAAVETLAQLTEKYPQSPHLVDSWLLTGQALEAQGKADAAIGAYGQMFTAAPDSRKPDALYSLGAAAYKAARYEQAADAFSKLEEGYSASAYAPAARLQLGLAQLAMGKTDAARGTLNSVASQDPARAAEARYGLAQCAIAEKDYRQARKLLADLIDLRPAPANIAQIALDHAVCAMELKDFAPAAAELQDLRLHHPNSPQAAEATYRQAFCLHKLGKYKESHALCREAARLKPNGLVRANDELDAENLFLMGDYHAARKQFAMLAQSAPDASSKLKLVFRQGQCAYFAGAYQDAAKLLAPLVSDPQADADAELRPANLLLGDALLQQKMYSQAIGPLKRYLRGAGSDAPQARYKLAMAEMHAGQIADARADFERATDGPADSPWVMRAWFERGQLDLKDKKPDEAAAAFRRAVRNDAASDIAAPAQYQLGWAEFQARRYPQAASAWKEMASRFPKDKLAPDARFQEGVALREARQFKDAQALLQAFAAQYPDDPNVVRAKQLAAACLKDMGDNDRAGQMLAALAAQAKGPGADSVLYDLAWSQRDAKNFAGAQASYRRLLADHADSKLAPAARAELAELLYDAKKYQDAADLLERVVSDKSADPKVVAIARYRLGWCYQQLKNPQKAAAVFAGYSQKGGGTDEMNASALLQAALAFAQDQKYPQAERSLAEALHKYPNQKDAPIAMLKLGEVQAEQNEFGPSQRTYQNFLDKYPSSEFAYRARFGIGWALENQKKYDEARAAYQKVIGTSNGPTAARAQFQIGETWLAEGKFKEAIPALLAVDDVYKYPQWSARALFEAGRGFEQLKQNGQARKQYVEIESKYKDSPEAGMARGRLRSLAGS